jgi:hypothetical protein
MRHDGNGRRRRAVDAEEEGEARGPVTFQRATSIVQDLHDPAVQSLLDGLRIARELVTACGCG